MSTVIVLFLALLIALFGPQFITTNDPSKTSLVKSTRQLLRLLGVVIFIGAAASTSFVLIGEDETGHIHKIYGTSDLTGGKIIATSGEKGPQARILPPGFQFSPFLNILNDVSIMRVIDIRDGSCG